MSPRDLVRELSIDVVANLIAAFLATLILGGPP
jgi:hypothetical protein